MLQARTSVRSGLQAIRRVQCLSTAPSPRKAGIRYTPNDFVIPSTADLPVPATEEANPTSQFRSYGALMYAFKRTMNRGAVESAKPASAPEPEDLQSRQIAVENMQFLEATQEREALVKNLQKMNGTSTKSVKRSLVDWYEPFLAALRKELKKIERNEPGADRKNYGPYLLCLPVEKIAVITLDSVIGAALRVGNDGVRVGSFLEELGSLIETEVKLESLRLKKDKDSADARRKIKELIKASSAAVISKRVKQILTGQESWSLAQKAKIGGFLLQMLVSEVKLENQEPVFRIVNQFNPQWKKKGAVLYLSATAFHRIDDSRKLNLVYPRLLPMLVPPVPWNSNDYFGAYMRLKAPLMKHTSRIQMELVRRSSIKTVLDGLDYMGRTQWRINRRVLGVIEDVVHQGLTIGEVPQNTDLALPRKEDYLLPPDENGVSKVDPRFYHIEARVKKRNSELHSLRCDMNIKLSIARQFVHDVVYFPHNIDFRGRAYPIPPNLSHIGSDLCRSLLTFNETKPLGEEGLRWLKIHLANLWGYNKVSFDDRVAWVDSHWKQVLDSATDPLQGDRWWSKAESPYQALATCIELMRAYSLPDPTQYQCGFPVHQDGSCNGLQHYAGLGRDELGGKAVNLAPADQPQDVYSKVLEIVHRKIAEDELIPADHPNKEISRRGELARLIKPVVSRKVIKQTVMTSVYGVTAIGARAQVQARIEEYFAGQGETKSVMSLEREQELNRAAKYVAHLTLSSLQEMFTSAREVMDWLTDVSRLVSLEGQTMSWITPLGLPVMQPYRKQARFAVNTVLQRVILTMSSDYLPVESRKQRSAFPPNFVHSLDATHMLYTCLRMRDRGLTFAAVHDSFWTHPCDASVLGEELRKSFIELYDSQILENLRDSVARRFPDIAHKIPPLPKRGSLDLHGVAQSKYFFH